MNYLSIILDLILVLIFAVFIINGRRKGFVNAVLTLVATAISIFVAYEFASPAAEWADGVFVRNAVVKTIADIITTNIGNGTQAVAQAVPSYIVEAAQAGGISINEVISNLGSSIDASQAAEQIYGAIYGVIVLPVLTVIAFLIIYAIINFCIKVIKHSPLIVEVIHKDGSDRFTVSPVKSPSVSICRTANEKASRILSLCCCDAYG